MKIIKEGKKPSEVKYRMVCYHCKSELEYYRFEVVKTYPDPRDGDSHFLGNCPVCSKELWNYAPREYRPHDGRGPG